MFELTNEANTYFDIAEHSTNFVSDEVHVRDQWIPPPQAKVSPESLGGNKEY